MDEATETRAADFWTRLRRRKVVQWGVAYVAGAWGLLQGLSYLSDTFDWPRQLQQLTTLILVVGLPIVLVLAWYHGDRGEQRVKGTELAIITLLFLLGGGIFWRYQQTTETSAGTATTASAPRPTTTAPTDPRPSIAVLPFENRSDVQKDAFFVDGIHDDILTQLSKVSALRVISRTSVERFRKTDLSMQQIAQQLGVKSILEGGVQRAGDRVRINVQLIDAATDAHHWAENYDRELTVENMFAIQSEVAQAIADVLEATLSPAEKARVAAVPTRSLPAWEAYQLGIQSLARRTSRSLVGSEQLFRKAIALDPEFALAYVGLSDALELQVDYSGAPLEKTLAEAEAAASKALTLNPDQAEAWASMGGIAMSRGHVKDAEIMLRRALALNANYATAHHWLSIVLRESAQQSAEVDHARRAVELDPFSVIANLNLGDTFVAMGRHEEAATRYKQVIDFDPLSATAYARLAITDAYARNRIADAAPLLERAIALDPGNPEPYVWLVAVHLDLGNSAQAERMVGTVLARWPEEYNSNLAAAVTYQLQGKTGAAVRHANKALLGQPRDSFCLRLLGNEDLRRGDPNRAKSRYASIYPDLLSAPSPRILTSNLWPAIDLALVLQRTGEGDRADVLLSNVEVLLATQSRLGAGGYGIADAQIHALRGDTGKALAAIREAQQAGWRGPVWRYFRDFDPTLVSIRKEPEFKSVFAEIERDMARQRAELAKKGANLGLNEVAASQ